MVNGKKALCTGSLHCACLLTVLACSLCLLAHCACLLTVLAYLQVCTDPRFGRMEENFAEDPHLVSQYGLWATRGLQGHYQQDVNTYLLDPDTKVHSCCGRMLARTR